MNENVLVTSIVKGSVVWVDIKRIHTTVQMLLSTYLDLSSITLKQLPSIIVYDFQFCSSILIFCKTKPIYSLFT